MSVDNERKSLLKNALLAVEEMQAKLDAAEQAKREPIAIVGMSCRYPGGANSLEQYWQFLHDGADLVGGVPSGRWDVAATGHLDLDPQKPLASWQGGFLDHVDEFDSQFFGIIPREANTMDPQQRLVLEVAWEALEHAGIPADSLKGSQTGVFIGITTNDYSSISRNVDPAQWDVYIATGSALNVVPGRLAYTLGLHGPSVAVDTACSSSLVALHLACQSLRSGESNLVITGGVNAILSPDAFLVFNKWGMMAPDGRCKTFDASADGFVRAEGCGIIVLKRLSDALVSGDRILALVRGSAVNQDGRSTGLTAPNDRAQEQVIRTALVNAGVQPHELSYIEAHGTGTSLGDPIEIEAIGAALREDRPQDQPLMIGSVKTNIGHAESAAGIAGVIKTVLAMQHGEIPPHLHLTERSSRIPWPDFPVDIPTQVTPWTGYEGRRLAGVSAFGFSGTNAHVILEGYTPEPPLANETDRTRHPITLSARTDDALREQAGQVADFLLNHPEVDLADAAHTLNAGRSTLMQRLALVASTREDAAEKLHTFAQGEDAQGLLTGIPGTDRPRVVFLFTGQGAQYIGMGRLLYETQPTFRAALDECDAILRNYWPDGLLPVIFPAEGQTTPLDHTAYTQPALFAIEYALAQLWMSWGVQPHAVLGHSVGEFTAACIAGVVSLEDGLRLIVERGRLMGALPAGGVMAAVMADEATVAGLIQPFGDSVVVATLNGPENTVISGQDAAVTAAMEALNAQGIKTRRLNVSHAFHSPLMEPMLPEFERTLKGVRFNRPRMRLAANVTGAFETDALTRPDYWLKQARGAVRFSDGIQTLFDAGYRLFLEIGPSATLVSMGQRVVQEGTWLASLRENRDDWETLLTSLNKLYLSGVGIDWDGVDRDYHRQKVALPTYPFQRQRYWVEKVESSVHRPAAVSSGHPLLGTASRSPLHQGIAYSLNIGPESLRFVDDHRIYGLMIFPGTGYFEMALAAGLSAGGAPVSLEHVEIQQPMILPDAGRDVQLVLTPEGGAHRFQVFSADAVNLSNLDVSPEWKLHALGQLALNPGAARSIPSLEAVQAACTEPMFVPDFYAQMDAIGLNYGPRFRGVTQIWTKPGDGEALGLIEVAPEFTQEVHPYYLYPGMLDSCFHLLGAALKGQASDDSSTIYLPVGVDRLVFYRAAGTRVWSSVRIHPAEAQADLRTGDIYLFGEDGAVVAALEGLQIRRANRQVLERLAQSTSDDGLYEVAWVSSPVPSRQTPPAGRWLILADQGGLGVRLADQLAGLNVISDLLYTSDIDFTNPTAFADVLGSAEYARVIHLWSLDAFDGIGAGLSLSLQSALHLVQTLSARQSSARLWFVTREAQTLRHGASRSLTQSPVWGLGRVVANEHPALWGGLLDIDAVTLAEHVLAALTAGDREDQVMLRSGDRYVARLQQIERPIIAADTPLELTVTAKGSLDNLVLLPTARREPGRGEVEIRVHATGLNFRDVLNVLGMYPGQDIPLGSECAGVVVAVGSGVTGVAVGDRVLALAGGAFNSYITLNAGMVFQSPSNLTLAEVSTIPSIFLTAYYGLHDLAGMKAGDRVLIHSAAGGVGLAAVQLAQRAGAEIFATAGSDAKRAYLRSIGVQHVLNSRTLEFADEIRAATGGRGVDIVLNSLADDFIPASLGILADGGRFLEIGKRGVWTPEQVSEQFPHVDYHIYDLAYLTATNPDDVLGLLRRILDQFAEGSLLPPPILTFPQEAVVDAFRYMAQSKHIGKLVITQDAVPAWTGFRDDSTYLVTGGLGGLGLKVAEWMAVGGARHLVLAGRSQPSESALEAIVNLESQGVQVIAQQVDVSDAGQVARLIEYIGHELPPLRGIIHAAGTLSDGVLAQQNWSRFETVLGPKVAGTWNLHQATLHLPLECFVMFSSGSAVFGAPGQGNYAAANTFMDALAAYRRACGLPALSINWGAWSEVGMAAGLSQHQQQRMQEQGIRFITPDQGTRLMGQVMGWSLPQIAVLPMNRALWQRAVNAADIPLLSAIFPPSSRSDSRTPSAPAKVAASKASRAKGTQFSPAELIVAEIWRELLGFEQFTPHDNFFDLGGNSLLAAEVISKVQARTGVRLESNSVHVQTLKQLAGSIQAALPPDTTPAEPEIRPAPAQPSAVAVADSHTHIELTDSREVPLYFGDGDQSLFGMYYLPETDEQPDRGVLICPPWGQEYIRAHRANHQLAIRLSNVGFPVLRFDYTGTGDSAGDDEANTISQSIADILRAVDELRVRSGVREVVLVGLRLGASLAVLAAQQLADVSHLVLWDPVVNGDAYLEDLNAWHQRNLYYYLAEVKPDAKQGAGAELLGFALSEDMLAELHQLDLMTLDRAPVTDVLLVERETSAATQQLRDHLAGLGIRLEYHQIDGPQMWTENPDKALVPFQTLQAILAWVTEIVEE
ncbi:MAG: SDR family NAD(P)-dependent oxidoreductase [Anaerolineae bacterium]|nr:SDR family NAD(P)-dependent oxidoreductase [Anaerolineae bacterium]